jgi:hypothetical protein
MKPIPMIALILCVCLFGHCAKKKKPQSIPQLPVKSIQKIPFVPPVDSTISVKQMTTWLACNKPLDSLSYAFADSFRNQGALRPELQRRFFSFQDTLCLNAGLSGGYEEYLWILKHVGDPANKKVLDSLKLSLFP